MPAGKRRHDRGSAARNGKRTAGRAGQQPLLITFVVLPAALGIGMLVAAFAAPPRPPQPPVKLSPADSSSGRVPARDLGTQPPPGPATALLRSEPVRMTISKIGVAADVVPVGINADGTLDVPPLDKAYLAGWYRPGRAPGEAGNAVIVGHVDSYLTGPAVFFDLGALRPGDTIAVNRRDKTVVQFTVDRVESYPKTAFPSELVYGAADKPGLRLMTCGGDFDEKARSYLNNIVIFATVTSRQPG